MRFFTLAIATLAVAISTNASIIQERGHTSGYQKCINLTTESLKHIRIFKGKVKNLTDSTANPHIHSFYNDVEGAILKEVPFCCKEAARSKLNAEDVKAVPAFQYTLFNEYDTIVSYLLENKIYTGKSKEPVIWAYNFATAIKDKISTLSTCLNPDDKTFIDKLNNVHSKLQDPRPIKQN